MRTMGYTELRPGQQDVIYRLLAGLDTICVLPTSQGKTACYVLPALSKQWGTLVYSPLIALMRDQVQGLNRKGLRADYVNSQHSPGENVMALRKWASGELQFLYVAPERLSNEEFMSVMRLRGPEMIVVDECFPGDTYLPCEFGNRSMLDLWHSWEAGEALPNVKSTDEANRICYRRIVRVMKRKPKALVSVKIQNAGVLRCTPDHVWITQRGEVKAGELRQGDNVYVDSSSAAQKIRGLNADQLQLVIGSYLGDGSVPLLSDAKQSYRLRMTHGKAQAAYCDWKIQIIGGVVRPVECNGYSGKPAVMGSTGAFQLPGAPGYRTGRWTTKVEVPDWMLETADERALAIWAMDDGSGGISARGVLHSFTFFTNSFSEEAVRTLSKLLKKKWNLDATVTFCKGWVLKLNKVSATRLAALVHPFLHVDLYYKFGITTPAEVPYVWDTACCPYTEPVVSVTPVPDSAVEDLFDIEVEGTHKFFVCTRNASAARGYITDMSVLVHNCHVISGWSDNFRPHYSLIGEFAAMMKPKVVGAFTATMTEDIEMDVRRTLGLQKAKKLFFYPRRENLILKSGDWEGVHSLRRLITAQPAGGAIVYCSAVTRTNDLMGELTALMPPNQVVMYHGKMTSTAKRSCQDRFMNDHARVCVATNAFGMGIDKENVRLVAHRDIPGSLESLSQETGRGGRDGLETLCMTFFDDKSVRTQKFFIDTAFPSKSECAKIFGLLSRSSTADGVVSMKTNEMHEATGIHGKTIGTILSVLMSSRVLDRLQSEKSKTAVSFQCLNGDDSDMWHTTREAILDISVPMGAMDTYYFEIDDLAESLGKVSATLRARLQRYHEAKFMNLALPVSVSSYRLIGGFNMVDFDRLREKEVKARFKLNQVIEYTTRIPDVDKHAYLENYFVEQQKT
jgi:hypothetical protein